jgi:hypothetical protein
VLVEELDERLEISPICIDRMRRQSLLILGVSEEFRYRPAAVSLAGVHGLAVARIREGKSAGSSPMLRHHSRIDSRALDECAIRRARRPRVRTGRGSSKPKLAFIGWNVSGFASARYLYSPPSIVTGGGIEGSSPVRIR